MKGLSVIITAYKASSFIEECLDSVYMSLRGIQRHEVVVGIDGCKSRNFTEVRKLKSFYQQEKRRYLRNNKQHTKKSKIQHNTKV